MTLRPPSFGCLLLVFSCLGFLFSAPFAGCAEELKIVFTGQSYAMLYPCECPREPDGGLSRRAVFLKKVRASSKNVLVLEAGATFASGPEDQYSKNAESDQQRTDVYMKALQVMGYDALLVSSQEYAFGPAFFKRYSDFPFVSSNMEGFSTPYMIKEVGQLKIGIIGLTDASVAAKGISGWQAPAAVLKSRVREVKKKGASLVILMSSLKPEEDKVLLSDISDIDIVINGTPSLGSVALAEAEKMIYLTTWWQARRVGVLTIDIDRGKIVKKNLESFRLSADLGKDEAVTKMLPACFSDGDCRSRTEGVARCENPGAQDARCVLAAQQKFYLTIVRPRVCRFCRTEAVTAELKRMFGEPQITSLFEDEAGAREIIREFGITMLPAYVLAKDIEQSPAFSSSVTLFNKGSSSYMLKSVHSGVSYFLGAERISKKLDVFFDFDYPHLTELFQLLKNFIEKHKEVGVQLHFLAIQDNDGTFVAKGGVRESEEFARAACIAEERPEKFLDYLICRAPQKDSAWWDDCASSVGIDAAKIKACVFSAEGKEAMRKHTLLTERLKLSSGPAFLVDNQEVFGIVNVPSLEEFEAAVLGAQDAKKKIR